MANKIQILLPYFQRPDLIRNALKSIQNQNYNNWEVHFIDDGEKDFGEEIVRNFFTQEELKKTFFYKTCDTKQQKIERGGSIFGKYLNDAMNNTDADICLCLCDDDALYPEYLKNLDFYYTNNSETIYAYCHVSIFNPFEQNFDNLTFSACHLNHTSSIEPYCMVDASQVSWRRKEVVKNNITFPYPQTANLDAYFYKNLFNTFGACKFTGFIGQYKAFYSEQLGQRLNSTEKVYDPLTREEYTKNNLKT